MNIKNEYLMNLVAIQIKKEDNLENMYCCFLYEYGLNTL